VVQAFRACTRGMVGEILERRRLAVLPPENSTWAGTSAALLIFLVITACGSSEPAESVPWGKTGHQVIEGKKRRRFTMRNRHGKAPVVIEIQWRRGAVTEVGENRVEGKRNTFPPTAVLIPRRAISSASDLHGKGPARAPLAKAQAGSKFAYERHAKLETLRFTKERAESFPRDSGRHDLQTLTSLE